MPYLPSGGGSLSAGQLDLAALLGSWLPVLHVQSVSDLEPGWTWTEAEIWGQVDEALVQLHRAARLSVVSLPLTTSGATVALPDRLVSVLHVAVAGATLRPATVSEVEALAGGGWRSQTGTPKRWVHEHDGDNVVRLWPAPTATVSVLVLAVVALDEVTGAAIEIPGWLGDAAIHGAFSQLMKREGDAAMPETAARCAVHAELYRQAAAGLYGVAM